MLETWPVRLWKMSGDATASPPRASLARLGKRLTPSGFSGAGSMRSPRLERNDRAHGLHVHKGVDCVLQAFHGLVEKHRRAVVPAIVRNLQIGHPAPHQRGAQAFNVGMIGSAGHSGAPSLHDAIDEVQQPDHGTDQPHRGKHALTVLVAFQRKQDQQPHDEEGISPAPHHAAPSRRWAGASVAIQDLAFTLPFVVRSISKASDKPGRFFPARSSDRYEGEMPTASAKLLALDAVIERYRSRVMGRMFAMCEQKSSSKVRNLHNDHDAVMCH